MKRKAGESLTEVPVSAKRQNNLSDNSDEELRRLFKHAESNRMHYHNKISLENDEQRQARLAKIRDNYKTEKHLKLMSKHRQNLLKEKTIIKREKHLRLISKDRQNLPKEGTVIKGKKTLIACKL